MAESDGDNPTFKEYHRFQRVEALAGPFARERLWGPESEWRPSWRALLLRHKIITLILLGIVATQYLPIVLTFTIFPLLALLGWNRRPLPVLQSFSKLSPKGSVRPEYVLVALGSWYLIYAVAASIAYGSLQNIPPVEFAIAWLAPALFFPIDGMMNFLFV